jgi:hypothetical protein
MISENQALNSSVFRVAGPSKTGDNAVKADFLLTAGKSRCSKRHSESYGRLRKATEGYFDQAMCPDAIAQVLGSWILFGASEVGIWNFLSLPD